MLVASYGWILSVRNRKYLEYWLGEFGRRKETYSSLVIKDIEEKMVPRYGAYHRNIFVYPTFYMFLITLNLYWIPATLIPGSNGIPWWQVGLLAIFNAVSLNWGFFFRQNQLEIREQVEKIKLTTRYTRKEV